MSLFYMVEDSPDWRLFLVYLRNSMTQSRLNHYMLLHIQKDRTDSIDTKDNASEFIQNCSTCTAY